MEMIASPVNEDVFSMRISTRRVMPGLALAAAALTLSACGSTVGAGSTGTLSSGGNGIDQGLGLGSTGAATPGLTSSGSNDASVAQGQAGTAGGGSAVDAGSSSTDAGTSIDGGSTSGTIAGTAAFPASGPGWDAKHVYIGMTNQSDVSGVAHSLGLKLDPGDVNADINAVVTDINQHGGIFGRQVKAYVQDNSTAKLQSDPNGSSQATCTYFTEDHKVMALINIASLLDTDTLRACMQKNKTPLMSVSIQPIDDQTINTYAPYLFSAVVPTWDTIMPILIKRLQAQGYFTGWNVSSQTPAPKKKPVIGIIYGWTPAQARIGKMMKQELTAAGYDVASTYQYGQNEKDLTATAVRFKAAGVTHVITDGQATGAMALGAQQQGYFPRYELTSYAGMEAILEDNVPKKQMVGSMGIGWVPTFDTAWAQDPGPVGAGTAHCQAVMAKAGIKFSARFAELIAYAICDGFNLVKDGATTGRSLEPLSVINGIKTLGPRFPQAMSFSSGLGQHSYVMPGGARDIAWDTGCSCFKYSGSTYRL
jgi:ABC-type branched-subunit amino acid transport system substrate-binding protein